MKDLIIAAIRGKSLLIFTYDGHRRTVEPHALGIFEETDTAILVAYQVSGTSSSSTVLGWRLFDIAQIRNLEVSNEKFFIPRPGYNPNDQRFSIIFAKL